MPTHIVDNQLRRTYYYSPNPQRRPMKKQPPKHRRVKFVVALLAIIGIAYVMMPSGNDPAKQPVLSSQTVAAQSEAKPIENIQETATSLQMREEINKVLAANPGVDISVSIVDLKSGKAEEFGPKVVYEAASIAKIITAINFLHQVQQGDRSLGDQLSGLSAKANIEIMITDSDNAAWKRLNDSLTHANLLSYAEGLGINDYDPSVNTLSSGDIAKILAKLYKGELLNQKYTQLLLSYMEKANRTDYIKAVVPEGVKFYHKAGWLDDRAHDAAIIDNGKRPYVLVIFTKDQSAVPSDRQAIIHNITRPTIDRYIGSN